MKTIAIAGIVLLPYLAFAATDCRVIEYPDRYEAICTGDAPHTPAPSASRAVPRASMPEQAQELPQEMSLALAPVQEQTFDALTAVQEQAKQGNAAGELPIMMSDLGRRHGASWLKTLPHQ